jgi:hypothetical protein
MKLRIAKIKSTKMAFIRTKAMAQGDLFRAVNTAIKYGEDYSELAKFGKNGGQFTEEERACLIEEIRALTSTRENIGELQNLLRVVETSPAISDLGMVGKVEKEAGRELKVKDRKNFRSRDMKRVFLDIDGKSYPAYSEDASGKWLTPYFTKEVADQVVRDWNTIDEEGGHLDYDDDSIEGAYYDEENGIRFEGEECYVDGELTILFPIGEGEWGWDIDSGYERRERNPIDYNKIKNISGDKTLAPGGKIPGIKTEDEGRELSPEELEITDSDKDFLRGMGIKGKRIRVVAVNDVNAVPEKFKPKETKKQPAEVVEGLGITTNGPAATTEDLMTPVESVAKVKE